MAHVGLTSVVLTVCGVVPVAAVVLALLAGAYRHYDIEGPLLLSTYCIPVSAQEIERHTRGIHPSWYIVRVAWHGIQISVLA